MLTKKDYGSNLRRKTPLRREGRRGRLKRLAKLQARKDFFEKFGQGLFAYCQICGEPLRWDQADACHKLDASLGGKEIPENLLIGCGLRKGPGNCNSWMDTRIQAKQEIRASPANSANGQIISLSPSMSLDLAQYKKSAQTSRPSWHRTSSCAEEPPITPKTN